jgi:hypothetical protein
MSTNFSIDTTPVADPIRTQWTPYVELDIDHTQKPIYGAYRSATLTFNTLTSNQFAAWDAADNGAYHTVLMEGPTGLLGTYTDVIVRRVSGESGPAGLIYGAVFRVERLPNELVGI